MLNSHSGNPWRRSGLLACALVGLLTSGCGSTPKDGDAALDGGGDGGPCVSDCTGRVCGDDGCGGQCPPGCEAIETCAAGQCVCAGETCNGVCCGAGGVCHAQTGACCAAETDAELCARLGADCGLVPGIDVCGNEGAVDNCGLPRTVRCGSCLPPDLCGGAGTPNQCEAASAPPVDPQYLIFNKTPTGGDPSLTCCYWYWQTPDSITGAAIDELVADLSGVTGSTNRRLAVSFTISYLEAELWQQTEALQRLLCVAEEKGIPVYLKLEGFVWWQNRPDLWNWWDPSGPGYDPNNRDNVEWTSWSADDAIRIAWRNWGSQIRVAPHPNLGSPAYLAAKLAELDLLLPQVVDWYDSLPATRKYLLAGVELDGELSIGVNFYHYPGGNALLDQPPANDPYWPADWNQLDGGYQQLGYAALTSLGIQTSGAIDPLALNHAVHVHADALAQRAFELGLDRAKVFTHGVAKPHLFSSILTPAATPGWSFYGYAYDPAEDRDWLNTRHADFVNAELGGTAWGATEWLYLGGNPSTLFEQWELALENTLGAPGNKLVNIFNFENVRANSSAMGAAQSVLGQSPACWIHPAAVGAEITGDQVTFHWLAPANAGAVYFNVSDRPERNPDGSIATINVINADVTGQSSHTQALPAGTYYYQVVVDGCTGVLPQRRITYRVLTVP